MSNEPIVALSLFDGISVAMEALRLAGIPVGRYLASEIDKFAERVSADNWPDIERLGDVQAINGRDLPKIDLIVFGSPCQGFSISGKGLNFEDPRSKLFFEAVRIIEECREKNPDLIFLMENVPMKRAWKGVISQNLGVEPLEIAASDFGAQHRIRMFWTNIGLENHSLFEDARPRPRIARPTLSAKCLADILEPHDQVDPVFFFTAERCRKLHGLAFSNEVKGKISGLRTDRNDKAMTVLGAGQNCGNNSNTEVLFVRTNDRGLFRNKNQYIKAPVFTGSSAQNNCSVCGFRRYTVTEVERLFSLPDGYTKAVSRSRSYRVLGNAFDAATVAHILKHIYSPAPIGASIY